AGCIEDFCTTKVSREQLIIDFFHIFYQDYQNLQTSSFLDFYRQRSYILHQNITVYENNQTYTAYVLDIHDEASLKIQTEKGISQLCSGEVSIRKKTSS
ncbi:MAG TPA: biotin--[acetyl-CoA-carboxylase] ligase, partial [Candidatus Massiliomicrobiota merdigallinarum]|nr:biotin--[acetyl-CoA-carboxylase] ligase [Candidatus Massilimicrobiota merdigallinarum]